MRLIDADEIMKALSIFNDSENGNRHFLYGIRTAKELIDDAPTVGGWISVKDRMPEPPAQCLVYSDKARRPRGMETATYTNLGWMTAAYFPEITHWMPLPEMPEEEENIMTETEKIIKGLQCCGQESDYGCDDCPYNVDPDDFTTCRQLYTDAVKQLKQLDALVKALELEKKEAEANE